MNVSKENFDSVMFYLIYSKKEEEQIKMNCVAIMFIKIWCLIFDIWIISNQSIFLFYFFWCQVSLLVHYHSKLLHSHHNPSITEKKKNFFFLKLCQTKKQHYSVNTSNLDSLLHFILILFFLNQLVDINSILFQSQSFWVIQKEKRKKKKKKKIFKTHVKWLQNKPNSLWGPIIFPSSFFLWWFLSFW